MADQGRNIAHTWQNLADEVMADLLSSAPDAPCHTAGDRAWTLSRATQGRWIETAIAVEPERVADVASGCWVVGAGCLSALDQAGACQEDIGDPAAALERLS